MESNEQERKHKVRRITRKVRRITRKGTDMETLRCSSRFRTGRQ